MYEPPLAKNRAIYDKSYIGHAETWQTDFSLCPLLYSVYKKCNSVNQKMPGSFIFMWVVPVFTVSMQLLTSVTDAIKLQKLEFYFSDVLMINININNAFMTASLYLITLMQTSETEEQVRKGLRHAHYDMAFRTCATHTRNL